MKKLTTINCGGGFVYLAASSLVAISLIASTSAVANTHQNVVEQRQQGFELIDTNIEQLEDELEEANVDWLRVKQLAKDNQQLSEQMLELFPHGSTDDSRAKKRIWDDWSKFEGMLSQMDQGFTQLYQAAEMEQLSTARQGLERAEDTCSSCHRKYRSLW